MSRRDRLILLVSYVIVFGVLFSIVAALGASVGPIEMIAILLVAIPGSVLVLRTVRSLLLRDAHRRV